MVTIIGLQMATLLSSIVVVELIFSWPWLGSMALDATLPRAWAERHVNLVHFSEMPRCGHFTAWEAPDEYARELQAFASVLAG